MKTETLDYLDEVIDETVIASCEMEGACDPGLKWIRETPRTYRELREHSEDWYCWLAEYIAIPLVLERLAEDANANVRRGVARNVNAPVAALESLAGDADAFVRYYVAQNVNTPVAVLEMLAGDADADVRRAVALNVNTPIAVLGSLAGDADAFVRYCAQSRLALLLERSSYEDETV